MWYQWLLGKHNGNLFVWNILHQTLIGNHIIRSVDSNQLGSDANLPKVVPMTRLKLHECYDDKDDQQNELIRMELSSNSNGTLGDQCRDARLPPPLSEALIQTKDWNFVNTFNRQRLVKGVELLSPNDLAATKRWHPGFPFCHPGPVTDTVSGTDDWFYADSIVQEVRLLNQAKPFYVVRWIGYEDM